MTFHMLSNDVGVLLVSLVQEKNGFELRLGGFSGLVLFPWDSAEAVDHTLVIEEKGDVLR